MCFEQLLLGLCLIEKVMSSPVCRCQSLERFIQVVILLEAFNHFSKLCLSTFDWAKPKKVNNTKSYAQVLSYLKAS